MLRPYSYLKTVCHALQWLLFLGVRPIPAVTYETPDQSQLDGKMNYDVYMMHIRHFYGMDTPGLIIEIATALAITIL